MTRDPSNYIAMSVLNTYQFVKGYVTFFATARR